MKIKIELESIEEVREAWANMSEEERAAIFAAALEKTKQDIKAEGE